MIFLHHAREDMFGSIAHTVKDWGILNQLTGSDLAGLRLAAVSEQHGKSKRTLLAALTPELSSLSEKELTQQLLSLLKHLPLLGTTH